MRGYNGICEAQQYSDEMKCGRCGLTWDANDRDAPDCLPVNNLPELLAQRARDAEEKRKQAEAERVNKNAEITRRRREVEFRQEMRRAGIEWP